ncbi:MAG: protein-glutamate O-methyltransferase CheR [Candidatus Manganitrophaceae bacterium]|nr:MAG: protein-glutamate O-methyltransferase CheR [Candidatus Manganitrophaceae bacterium]
MENGESPAPEETGIRPITDREFSLFQELIYKEAGIYLSGAKKPLLEGRLSRRMRELGLHSFNAYYHRVLEQGEAERVRLLDAVSTNETHFFREPLQFEFLERRLFPEWAREAELGRRPRKIRAWSAGCSSGEEPYSLAMTLLFHFPSTSGWNVEIFATDLSTRMLERARNPIWPIEKTKEIPPQYLKPFMLRGTRSQEGKIKAGPEIRSVVRFDRLNLNEDGYPFSGPFDLIFCRNVLIYFDTESKKRVLDRLLRSLSPAGHLFIGHAESLTGLGDRVRSVIPTVYMKGGSESAEWSKKS